VIQQQPSDVLEIHYEGRWYYLVVVTKIIMFGGNVVYAFHGNGEKIKAFKASSEMPGFNICTDLLLPKKEGEVIRIGKVTNPSEYLVSHLMKGCNEHRPGFKAKEWFLYSINEPQNILGRVKKLKPEQELAMDYAMFSFDLTAKKILDSYTPDNNQFINKKGGMFGLFS